MHRKSSVMAWRNQKKYSLGNEQIKGVVESFTIVNNAPASFDNNAPYILGIIALADGKKVVSQIVDADKVEIGMKVEPCLRRIYVDGNDGLINYGTKFRLIK